MMKFTSHFLEDSRQFMLSDAKLRLLADHFDFDGQKVLDVGCGTGYFTRQFAKACEGDFIGLDINRDLINVAKQLSLQENLRNTEFVVGDGCLLEFPDNYFSRVTCQFLLSRVPTSKANEIIAEMKRVIKKGGKICLLEPCLSAKTSFYRNSPRLSVLLEKIRRAKAIVQQKAFDIDEDIGISLPKLLNRHQLANLKTEILALLWWSPPPMKKSDISSQMREWFGRRLLSLEKPNSQETKKNYGTLEDAASVLRLSPHETEGNGFLSMYGELGVTMEEILELNGLRIKYLHQILDENYESDDYLEIMELIPTFAVVGEKI